MQGAARRSDPLRSSPVCTPAQSRRRAPYAALVRRNTPVGGKDDWYRRRGRPARDDRGLASRATYVAGRLSGAQGRRSSISNPTPLLYSEALSRKLGFDLWLKCENLQPIGAFKIRGGIYLISKLSAEQRARGVVSASTGNHGQSIAYAGRLFGARVVICVPENVNPIKAASMERLGAEVVRAGPRLR